MSVIIEIIGVEPPCHRCKETLENAKKAAERLKSDNISVTINKLDVMEDSTMDRFGLVKTPVLVINGVVKIMGKVPDPGVIERLVRKEL